MLDLTTTSPSGTRVINVGYGYDGSAGTLPPIPISPYSTLTVPAYWRALNFLSDNLASFPRSVRIDGAKPPTPHRLTRLLARRPNGYQNAYTFWRTLFFHAAHYGNGMARVERGGFGFEPVALHNLLPHDTYPFRYDRGDGRGVAQYYLHRPTRTVLPAADVIHVAALAYDGMSGIDPVGLHSATFQRAATIDRYQTRYLQKGTMIRGSIEIPASASPEQVKEIKALLREQYQGPDAERDVLILSDGATLKNTTLSPQQSQMVEQTAAMTKAIAQLTGVPPQFLYEFSESKYNNSIEQMGQDVVRYTFRPWIEQAEDELTLKLLTEAEADAGYAVGINPDALLRGDTKAVNESATTTVNAGLRTRNEGRALLGLPPDTDPESNKLKTLGDTAPPPAAG